MSEYTGSFGLRNVSKFIPGPAGSKLHVLEDVNFQFNFPKNGGYVVSVLAPFGTGKTTLLRISAALEKPSEGEVLLNGNRFEKPDGRVIFIPAKPSSFPWLSVKENLLFAAGLQISGRAKEKAEIQKLIDAVGLTGYEDHFPQDSSLGFRFRISLARALAASPSVILIDDSLKNMHGLTRTEIYELILKIKEVFNISFVITSTNISEAIALSDKIFLLKGRPSKIIKEIKVTGTAADSDRETHLRSVKEEIEKAFAGESLMSEIK